MRTKCKVGGRHFSLNGIETNEIRKRFQEPRIHFAIVCASRGCPWLSSETFTAEHLEEQLEARSERSACHKSSTGISRTSVFSPEAALTLISKYRTVDGVELRQGK